MPMKRSSNSYHTSITSIHILQHQEHQIYSVSSPYFHVGLQNPLILYENLIYFSGPWWESIFWNIRNRKHNKKKPRKKGHGKPIKQTKKETQNQKKFVLCNLVFKTFYLNGGTFFCAGPSLFEAILFWYLLLLDYLNVS